MSGWRCVFLQKSTMRIKGKLGMKIVMVTPFPAIQGIISGGVAGVSYYLAEALTKIDGISIEVIYPDAPVEHEKTAEFNKVRVHYLPRVRGIGSAARMIFTGPRAVKQKLEQLNFDIVHVQGVACWTNFLKCPYVLTIHGIPERDVLFRGRFTMARSLGIKLVEGWARRKAKNVIVISPYVVQVLAGELKGRVTEIENPVADSFFEIENSCISGRILYGGQIIPRKNIEGLIRAFSIVHEFRSDAVLRLAGSGAESDYGRRCKKLVCKLGLEKKVSFLGNLTIVQMQKELSQASCLALCSHQETAPVIIEEAMAAGVPVVASNICGIPYMVKNGVTGKVVDPNNYSNMAEGILSVLSSENFTNMAQAARCEAENRFRASKVARRTCELYRNILKS
ncbi:MAG: hypothetical protein CVV39_01290 [Planctomycetes bacterium HGW-Planctomycetes-1]|nr:MAG: hypothetical protein CVV39_01290 [Planctomycetes bacterium HGW-Planctomycetes-1]